MLSGSRTARGSLAILPRRWERVVSGRLEVSDMGISGYPPPLELRRDKSAVAEARGGLGGELFCFSQNDVALTLIGGECPTC